MSLNAEHGDRSGAGAGAAAGLQAPKLRTGGYAAWGSDMDVHLARINAGSAHKRAMERDHWLVLVAKVLSSLPSTLLKMSCHNRRFSTSRSRQLTMMEIRRLLRRRGILTRLAIACGGGRARRESRTQKGPPPVSPSFFTIPQTRIGRFKRVFK